MYIYDRRANLSNTNKRQKQNSLALPDPHTHTHTRALPTLSMVVQPPFALTVRWRNRQPFHSCVYPSIAKRCFFTSRCEIFKQQNNSAELDSGGERTIWCKQKTADVTCWRHTDKNVTCDWPVVFLQNTSVSEMNSEQTRLRTSHCT